MPWEHVNWEVFSNFGLAGLTLGVFFLMFVLVMKIHAATIKGIVTRMSSDHRDSNEAWRVTFAQHSTQADNRQAETNAVLRDLTKVMAENNACLTHIKSSTYRPMAKGSQ